MEAEQQRRKEVKQEAIKKSKSQEAEKEVQYPRRH